MQQIASQNAPSARIVIPHFLFGGAIWLVVTVLLTFFPESLTQHYFNPKLLAITHLVVLGWISMVIFGALYQLIPVILGVKLFSEKLALISFLSLASGTVLLAISFWNFWLGVSMHIAAILILLAVSVFTVNVLVTGKKSAKNSIEKDFIQAAVIWLLFTVVVGIALAINLTYPYLSISHLELLKLHAHAGIVGWFIQLIMGVGSKLLPMFMVSHQLNQRKLIIAYYLVNFGLIAAIICLYTQLKTGLFFSSILVVIGLAFFLSYLFEAYKKRVKKKLDAGMKQSVYSFLIIAIPAILVLLLLFDTVPTQQNALPWIVVYGSSLLIGFISSLIMGQTYKTLPFIVWLKVYRGKIGKGKIPFPKDLYSENTVIVQLWTFAVGFTVLLVGIAMQHEIIVGSGSFLLLFSVLIYNWNMIKIVRHKYDHDE